MSDMVNHPNHYADKKIEVIDYIRDTLTHEGFTEYCCGNVIKYISRWRKKGWVEDLRKAAVYLDWMIDSADSEPDPRIITEDQIKENIYAKEPVYEATESNLEDIMTVSADDYAETDQKVENEWIERALQDMFGSFFETKKEKQDNVEDKTEHGTM